MSLSVIFIFALLKDVVTSLLSYGYINHMTWTLLQKNIVLICSLPVIMICLAQSLAYQKLAYLVYNLPEKFRWVLIKSQAYAAITASLYYATLLGFRQILG